MNRNKVATHLMLIAAMLFTSGCGDEADTERAEERSRTLDYTGEVAFLGNDEEPVITIEVAIADNQEERNEGLMHVTDLPSDNGMLFLFEDEAPRSFWMANTPLSLDIIYVSSDREIVRIHHSVPPYSENSFPSGEDAQYVVETNGGFCVSHDIREGMQVSFELPE